MADDLVQRLRGIYTVPVNDGCGPLNGSMECTRTFDVPPIHKEAADAIERKDAEIAELRKQVGILELKNRGTLANNLCPDHRDKQQGKPCLACAIETLERKGNEQRQRAERAEARVAALEESLHYANGVADLAMKHRDVAEARIADAPTVCANTDNIVEIAHSLGYYDGKRVALVPVDE